MKIYMTQRIRARIFLMVRALMFYGFLICSLLLIWSVSFSAVITVPGDYSTIQAAINAASNGDEIIVSPGTYTENINFNGKNIILRSTDPTNPSIVDSTIIDGNNAGTVVSFYNTEDSTCVLAGFTIRNGNTSSSGGGINGGGSQATILCNKIINNTAAGDGGGLYNCRGVIQKNIISGNTASSGGGLSFCNGPILHNTITGNTASGGGGGLAGCAGDILYNTITNNSANASGGGLSFCQGNIENNIISQNYCNTFNGGGLYYCNYIIKNNIISGNTANSYGGGLGECSATIQNNIIRDNSAQYGGGLYNCPGTIQNNIIVGNSALYGGGLSSCDGTIRNNVISYNTADSQGGGLRGCSAHIINCIISHNHNGGIVEVGIYGYTYEAGYCNIAGNTGGDYFDSATGKWYSGTEVNNLPEVHNCISTDSRFINPDADFRLRDDSPCIDAGNPAPEYNDGNLPPGKGTERSDIGCYGGQANSDWFTAHYPFSTDEEGWTFQGEVAPFDQPDSMRESGHIGLNANSSTNCFSYWFSPDVMIGNNRLYYSSWLVGSSATSPDLSVQFRLRVNQKGSWQGWGRTVNSFNQQGPSSTEPKWYGLYFLPQVAGVDDNVVTFSFDIMSFDPGDDINSWLYLEEMNLEEVSITTTSAVLSYDFESGSEGWQFAGTIPPYDEPRTNYDAGHIGLSPDGSTNCFSYWYSPDVNISDGRLYRARFELSSSETYANDSVQCRLRVNQKGAWQGWERVVNSNYYQSPSQSEWKTYSVLFSPKVTDTSDNLAVLSFDIMSFDPNDATTSWLYLESVQIEEITVVP